MGSLPQGAFSALGRASHTHLAAKPNDAVAEIRLLLGLDDGGENLFDLVGILQLLRIEAQPPANTDTMGVGNHGGLAVEIANDQIGNLPPHAGERQEIVDCVGHAAAKAGEELLRHGLQILGLHAIEAAGAHQLLDLSNGSLGHGLGGGEGGEQVLANQIDAGVGALGREPRHDEKLPRIALVSQSTGGFGIACLQFFYR